MSAVTTTKMSSKGQIVIPDRIRESLHLVKGTEFIVVSSGDAVILKPISPLAIDEFSALLKKARAEAKKAGLKKVALQKTLKEARRSK